MLHTDPIHKQKLPTIKGKKSLLDGDSNYLKTADIKDWIYQYDWEKKKYTKKKIGESNA